ncbi:hypothetical protein G7B40_028970 [Aetokthonos hydrillicola Thurmond2011]|jgi:hypothetical protein|uniref:Uncharacterized protein n=1 Tax=Aetokthonos hydrillicola Thurmond2011 TaxID=2712845 RepID=A0AAP5ICC9_9CYAN|nr:hypothetical protein [Aetokthonos hydrillicola]MBW4584232.1 hypothetical protein [Aetokthonos hydrillicola CCALA 1050]MDR9898559.1 hypothetical protein [Aetokthonos hydrillicola Thurmond2011]
MPEKLLQAAIITFLLYVIAGLSPVTRIQTHSASTTDTTSPARVLLSARQ